MSQRSKQECSKQLDVVEVQAQCSKSQDLGASQRWPGCSTLSHTRSCPGRIPSPPAPARLASNSVETQAAPLPVTVCNWKGHSKAKFQVALAEVLFHAKVVSGKSRHLWRTGAK